VSTYVEHAEHGVWTQRDHDVVCACGQRLYAGRSPRGYEHRKLCADILDRLDQLVREGRS
jgi:hypothetical protein